MLIMSNLFKTFDVGTRFDLKGSIASRTRLSVTQRMEDETRDIHVALKDNDFRRFMRHITFAGSLRADNPPLLDILQADTEFLARNNLIDYSLLVGQIQNEPEELHGLC
jgi:hypothetical protein